MAFSPFKKLGDITKEAGLIAGKYQDKDKISTETGLIYKKIEDKTLNIIFFGAYNSGKSTLINAFLGENKARTGDIPTTDCVSKYNYNGFVLVDTPGVNAPVQHEKMTREELSRGNLILFIIKEGDQDTKDIYNRIFELKGEKKEIFLVLNYENDENKDMFIKRIYHLLFEYEQKHDIAEKIKEKLPLVPVNAKSAMKGRIENKNRLVEISGYHELERRFEEWFIIHNNENKIIKDIQEHIEKALILPTIDKINKETADKNLPLEELSRYRQQLSSKKNLMLLEMHNTIRTEISCRKNMIIDALKSPDPQLKIHKIYEDIVCAIEPIMEKKLNDVNSNMRALADKFAADNPVEHAAQDDDAMTMTTPPSSFVNNEMVNIGFNNLKSNAEKISFKALKFGRKLKIPFLKGRWETTLNKWAKSTGAVVTVLISVVQIYMAQKEEENINRRQTEQAFALYHAMEEICTSISSSLFKDVKNIIHECFKQQEAAIDRDIERVSSVVDMHGQNLQKMYDLKRRLYEIL